MQNVRCPPLTGPVCPHRGFLRPSSGLGTELNPGTVSGGPDVAERQCCSVPIRNSDASKHLLYSGNYNSTYLPGWSAALSERTTKNICMCLALGESQSMLSVTVSRSDCPRLSSPPVESGSLKVGVVPMPGTCPTNGRCSMLSIALNPGLTHSQLSSLSEGQLRAPDGHAEVDTTVFRLHTVETENGLG